MAQTSDIRNLLDFVAAPGLGYFEFQNLNVKSPPPLRPATDAPAPRLPLRPRPAPTAAAPEPPVIVPPAPKVESEPVAPEPAPVAAKPVEPAKAETKPENPLFQPPDESPLYGAFDFREYGAVAAKVGVREIVGAESQPEPEPAAEPQVEATPVAPPAAATETAADSPAPKPPPAAPSRPAAQSAKPAAASQKPRQTDPEEEVSLADLFKRL